MPVRFLSEADRARLSMYPAEITEDDLGAHFTLSPDDQAVVRRRRREHNRLGFALQLCTLRFLGFLPEDLMRAPRAVVSYLADQLGADASELLEYGERGQTRTDHAAEVQEVLGFRTAGLDDLARLGEWLLDRAMEHDRPTLLFQLAAEHVRAAKVVRPGVTVLERMVASARDRAERETFRRLGDLLTDERRRQLEALLEVDADIKQSRFAWLRKGATEAKPTAVLQELRKLDFVRGLGADRWDLGALNPNRVKFLAQVARRMSASDLQRASNERRLAALVAFLAESVWQLSDEVVDLFDRALHGYHAGARKALDALKATTARAANEKVLLFSRLAEFILDEDIADADLRAAIWKTWPRERLAQAKAEADQLARPIDDNYFDLLAHRYPHIRQFAPSFLAGLDLRANAGGVELLRAAELLRQLNADGQRRVPDEAPLGFVTSTWRPYVIDSDGRINRTQWELCLLTELRGALRSGDVWVASSRRYANPETFLVPVERWPSMRVETCALLGIATNPAERLDACAAEMTRRLDHLDRELAAGTTVRIEDGEAVLTPLAAEELPEESLRLQALVADRLPKVELAEVLIEVDRWCNFTKHLTHAGGAPSRTNAPTVQLYAAILAQACNFGLANMSEVADLSARQLAWTTQWYLRDETLQAATTAIVNYQHGLPLAGMWGGGTMSSSDGQRFPVSVKSTTATSIPRYFGFGRGLTFYTWTSDQFSQFGTKVISSTVRDATYVLDGLLDNETELKIVEHTTDTAGYTDLVFALFDLLGLQFSPRLRDVTDHRLYRLAPFDPPLHRAALFRGTINRQLIIDHWDDLLRVAGSLKLGWVTASLLISRLNASPRKNAVTKALQEYGRVAKTLFVLRYLESEDFRRRVNRQLNKGESLHALRAFLFFAEEGRVRRRHLDEQTNQAQCLNLVSNAVITWNTIYIAEVLRQLRTEGHVVHDDAVAHLAPTVYGHINRYGKYRFDVPVEPGQLRPLREPGASA